MTKNTERVSQVLERATRLEVIDKAERERVSAITRGTRIAQRESKTGGTGYTILKLRQPPLGKLIDAGKLGPAEIQAAQEIEKAFNAIASRLMIRGASLEKIDRGHGGDIPWPVQMAREVKRFQDWSNYWSKRKKLYGDVMLEVIISVVIDQREVRNVGEDLGFGRHRIERAVIAGLRDYAARAEMVSPSEGERWKDAAGLVFVPGHPGLLDAVRRSRLNI